MTGFEFFLLIAVFCGPVYLLAAVVQWRLLAGLRLRWRKLFAWLALIVIVEVILTIVVWSSPLGSLLPYFRRLGFANYPVQSALIAAAIVTAVVWGVSAKLSKRAENSEYHGGKSRRHE